MTYSTVCADSNVLLNLYLSQPLSQLAEALWNDWVAQGHRIIAPPLLRYEVTGVLRNGVYQRRITAEKGAEFLQAIFRLPIEYLTPSDLHTRAYTLATQLKRPTAYDAHYLVVAQTFGCEFWTADNKLVNAVSDILPWVKFLGDYEPT